LVAAVRRLSYLARKLRRLDSGIHQQMRKSSRHLTLAFPRTTHERSRKRKLATPSRCLAALGTQKVAIKKEKARGVKYLLFAIAQA
jgi:hypothetical protein